jgi:hypothetical protein
MTTQVDTSERLASFEDRCRHKPVPDGVFDLVTRRKRKMQCRSIFRPGNRSGDSPPNELPRRLLTSVPCDFISAENG